MKKILIVAATAGLMSLAACNGGTTNTTENTADNTVANAAIYDTDTANSSNVVADAVVENASTNATVETTNAH